MEQNIFTYFILESLVWSNNPVALARFSRVFPLRCSFLISSKATIDDRRISFTFS